MTVLHDAASTTSKIVPADERTIFISYCRRDKAFVQQLCAELEKHDRKAWVDWTAIPPLSPNFLNDIKAGIEESYSFAFVLSPAFIESPYCRIELDYAIEQNKRLVPILHQDIVPETLPEVARVVNWLMFRESDPFEAAFDSLLKALDTDLEWTRSQAYLNRRAREWDDKQRGLSFLLRGSELKAADGWLAKAAGDSSRQPTALQAEYILASSKYAARSQRTLLSVVSAGLVLAVVLALFAVGNYFDAKRQTRNAERQTGIANQETLHARSAEVSAKQAKQAADHSAEERRIALIQAKQSAANEKQAANKEKIAAGKERKAADAAHVSERKAKEETGVAKRERNAANEARMDANTERKEAVASAKRARMEADNANHLLYDSDMALIQHASETNNIGHIRALLDETRANPERNFEWGYWNYYYPPALVTFNHSEYRGGVAHAVFSSDGRCVFTSGQDGTAKVWEVRTEKCLLTVNGVHASRGNAVTLSPDDKRFVIASGAGRAKVCDVRDGHLLLTLNEVPDDSKPLSSKKVPDGGKGVLSCAYSPNGERILVCWADDVRHPQSSCLDVFNAVNGHLIVRKRFTGNDFTKRSAAFSPDSKRIVVVDNNLTTFLDAETCRYISTLPATVDFVSSASFSPDGKYIILNPYSETRKEEASVWNIETGKLSIRLAGSLDMISASFSPDGERIVVGGVDGLAKVWNAKTGKCLFILAGHNSDVGANYGGYVVARIGRVNAVSFSPDGKRIVTCCDDGTTKVWDARLGYSHTTIQAEGLNELSRASFSPDGNYFLAGITMVDIFAGSKHVLVGITMSDIATQPGPGRYMLAEEDANVLGTVYFSADGKRTIVCGYYNIKIRPTEGTGEVLRLPTPDRHFATAFFSPDDKHVIASKSDAVEVWDARTGQSIFTTPNYHTTPAVSPDGRILCTTSGPKQVDLWEVETGRKLRTLKAVEECSCMIFSPDGKRLLTGDSSRWGKGGAQVWDTGTWNMLRTLPMRLRVSSAPSFSPDGKYFVTGGDANTAKVWNVKTWQVCMALAGHTDSISSAVFSPDSKRVITGSMDRTAKVWDIGTGREVLTFSGDLGTVRQAMFSPDGKHIVTSNYRSVTLWPADFEDSLADFSLKPRQKQSAKTALPPRIPSRH